MRKIVISIMPSYRMALFFLFILISSACTLDRKKNQTTFPVLAIADDEEWVTYEGKWLTEDGIILLELSLKSGAFGQDSYYRLNESFESDSSGKGAVSQGLYSTYDGFPDNELGICLHDVNSFGAYLRFKKPNGDDEEQMFFLTRGDELMPSDNNFKPLTTDRRSTLHRRSKLFTVEGYFTLERDGAEFFERNTNENWKVADLGEFNELTLAYNKLAREKFEGVYLKALAYSVTDTTLSTVKNSLVIKHKLSFGNDPDL